MTRIRAALFDMDGTIFDSKIDLGVVRRVLGATAREALAIGDAHLDLLAAHRAGVAEIILVSPPPWVLDFIPEGIPHRRAADLHEAQAIAESLLG
jgi:phosphoglycolate phosphatase-like HAD superfamily hydrolase